MKRTGTAKVLSGISALALAFAAAAGTGSYQITDTETVFAEDTAAASEQAVKYLSDEQIKGTWEGTYDGYLNSDIIKRTLKLDIYDCTDGKVKGFAEITSEECESYYFTGTYDSETGKMSFSGNQWIKNSNDFGFGKFAGTVDPDTLTFNGNVDGSSAKVSTLKKVSDSFTSRALDLNTVHKQWNGEYDGFSGDVVVRRNYKFIIDTVSEDGKITGKAYFSPSEKADQQYAETGSYEFSGSINPENGIITMQGHTWIEHPKSSNFDFVRLSGWIGGDFIDGGSEKGIWKMDSSDIVNGDVNYDNKLGAEDLIVMKRYILGDLDFSQAMVSLTDMNGDGVVNVMDFNITINCILNS